LTQAGKVGLAASFADSLLAQSVDTVHLQAAAKIPIYAPAATASFTVSGFAPDGRLRVHLGATHRNTIAAQPSAHFLLLRAADAAKQSTPSSVIATPRCPWWIETRPRLEPPRRPSVACPMHPFAIERRVV
jgi:hypothetical protein